MGLRQKTMSEAFPVDKWVHWPYYDAIPWTYTGRSVLETLFIIKIALAIVFVLATALYLTHHLSSLELPGPVLGGVSLLLLALFVAFFATIATQFQRLPLGNLAEAFYFALFCLFLSGQLLEFRLKDRSFALILLPVATILAIVGPVISQSTKTLPPEMQSLHWPFHVTFAIVSYVFLFIAFIAAVTYILKHYQMKHKGLNIIILTKSPPLESMERYMLWSVRIGLLFLTAGIVLGGMWMKHLGLTLGQISLMPKVLFSLLTWIYFLVFLGIRHHLSLYAKKGSYLVALGFIFVIVTFSIGNHAF